jgi:hypothetical protein
MLDKNVYHLTRSLESTGLPSVHGDVFRPSDYIVDKIYLMSKDSDILTLLKKYPSIISGFDLFYPSGASIQSGKTEYHTAEYSFSISPPNDRIQFDDGYVIISLRNYSQLPLHDKTGVSLPNPYPIQHFFGIIYCPREYNKIENISTLQNGITYYVYIRYQYDNTQNRLFNFDISRRRHKTGVNLQYVFLGADHYTIETTTSPINFGDPLYPNVALLCTFQKTGSNITLKLSEYNADLILSNSVAVQNNSYSDAIVSLKLKNLSNRHYEWNFQKIYTKLNSDPEHSIVRHTFENRTGKILLDSHFNDSSLRGILTTSSPSTTITMGNNVEYLIFLKEVSSSPKQMKAKIKDGVCVIEYSTFDIGDIDITFGSGNFQISKTTSNDINYFIYKIDQQVFET